MRIISLAIILKVLIFSSCATIKTEHHITLDHNIRVDLNIDGQDAISFFDELTDPVSRYERSIARAQNRAINDSVDMFVNYLYSDVE
jgi:hypothetical protein